jgi:hypothetical protein
MQTWSQIVDPALSRADLPRLGERLNLPDGWTYQTRKLADPLRIDTASRPGSAGRPGQQLFAVSRLTRYRYWPRLDSVSIARDALELLPVTSVRM